MLEVKNVSAGYGKVNILENISFSAEDGGITCILGANGSGKTTLLKAICGLLPHAGTCFLDGQNLGKLSIRELSRVCSYVPQRSGIAIDLSLLEVVVMGFNPRLRLLERPSAAMEEGARAALHRVGLGGREEENYQTLSEGQKQLCILARTLVSDGKCLLLDEPESALDIRRRSAMLAILRDRVKDGGCTLVTLHDPTLALNSCRKLVLLEGGRVSAVLYPEGDSLETMETALSKIYGSLTLARCRDKQGKSHIVMLKEEEI